MRRDLFRDVLDSRINTMRKYVVDPSLTPKQRAELKKAIQRRERVGNNMKSNKYIGQRVNTSIYSTRSPKNLRAVASRYRNALTPNQRSDLLDQLQFLRLQAEQESLRNFLRRGGDPQKLLRDLRELRRHSKKTMTHVGARSSRA